MPRRGAGRTPRDAISHAGFCHFRQRFSLQQVFGAVRAQLDAGARQLKPLAKRGLPLVIVLANPQKADVSLEPRDVMAAMYGNPAFATSIVSSGVGDEEFFLHRDGAFTAKAAYVSAVVTLH